MSLLPLAAEETCSELSTRVEHMKRRRGKPIGFSTGYPALNRPFGGLVPGEVTVLAGRPAMGKTALFMNIARFMAGELVNEGLDNRYAACLFSLEMSRDALLTREALADTGLSSERFRIGEFTDQEYERFLQAVELLGNVPILVDDTPAVTVAYMVDQIEALRASGIQPVVIGIDHIGITGEKGSGLYESATRASNGMKRLAKIAKAPVLALAQLNRAVEQRTPPVPILSDLRETGAIEQDADNVCLLYRHDYYFPLGTQGHDPARRNVAEILVAKARNGQQGAVVRLRFDASRTRFESM